jgi:unconventional prefoldin RPB5 interactor 1
MSDKDREHARIIARLDELEREEKEAGSTSEEDDDDDDEDEDEDDGDAGTSEDGEENKEPGNALSDGNENHSSSFGTSFSGSGGNDRSRGIIKVLVSQANVTYDSLVHSLELFILILLLIAEECTEEAWRR